MLMVPGGYATAAPDVRGLNCSFSRSHPRCVYRLSGVDNDTTLPDIFRCMQSRNHLSFGRSCAKTHFLVSAQTAVSTCRQIAWRY